MLKGNDLVFNGYDLSEILIVSKFDKGVRLGRTSKYQTRSGRKGVDYLGFDSEVIRFTTDFLFKPEVTNKKEKLAEILNVNEPKPLTISSEPGIVYYAFPAGDIDSDETSIFGDGRIVWEIPDGVAYSEQEYNFKNSDPLGNNLNYIIVDNPGTEPMELELEAIFSSDNGFLRIENEDRSVRALFGDMAEVDGTPYEKSEQLFDDHFYLDQGWSLNNGVVPPVTANPRQAGTVSYNMEREGDGFTKATNYGPVVSDWSGPSLTKTVPVDSEGKYPLNWLANFRWDFNTVGAGSAGPAQVGHQSMTFVDQNDNIIVSIIVEDNYGYAEKSDFAVYIRDKRVYDSRKTDMYYVTARPGQNNHIAVEKHEDRILIRLPVNNPGLNSWNYIWLPFTEKNVELRKVTWYAARYKAHGPITNNLLRAINVVKWNVQKWKDIPNKFMAGDVLTYGKNDRNIYCAVNNFNELRLRDVGSTLITAPPGESIFHLSYSGFTDPPEVTLTGRARYIL